MQDSLEDYLQLSKNKRQDEALHLNKESQISAQIKKDCDLRALKIVEFSIAGKLRPEILFRCLSFINQDHYQDIVEERALTKLCGYSLCGKRIPEMPKKQFYISTKSNRVYDITDRKNYCSNFCFKASLHIKKQIDNSPLWLRKYDECPKFQLLCPADGGLPGELIDQGMARKPAPEPTFTSVSNFTEVSLTDMEENEINPTNSKPKPTPYRKSSHILKSTMQTISENVEQSEEAEEELVIKHNTPRQPQKPEPIKQTKSHIKILPAIDENEEKSYQQESPKYKMKRTRSHKSHSKLDIESTITKSLSEWITLESYIFIFGETKVKEVLDEKKLSSYFASLRVNELNLNQQVKYMNICKRLHLQDMAEEKFDQSIIGNSKLQPLPDYKKLKEEGQELNIKVRDFYSGVMTESLDQNFPVENVTTEDTEESPAIIPMVDANSQTAMRRKIFLNSINKSFHQMLLALHVQYLTPVLSDLQGFVRTFQLRADNIVFKPVVWNYISITLLYLLSLKNEDIKDVLMEKRCQDYIELSLAALPNQSKFVKDTMTNFQNIEHFVENYVTNK